MSQCLSSGKGQGGSDAGNVPEVEECRFCNLVNMGQERELGVKNNAEVADLFRGGYSGAINVE